MPGSSIAINGANAISAVCVVYRCQVAFLRSSRPAAWACMHWTGRWKLHRWDKIIWLFPEPRSAIYVRNSGPSAALPEEASLPLGTMCATQARPRLNTAFARTPPSPEGDHFLQPPDAEAHVLLPHPALVPPRRNALRCIRDGTRGWWHGGEVRGKSSAVFSF